MADRGTVSRFLVAPDSFKGCLACDEVAGAIARGVRDAWPEAAVTTCPLSDGGEGLLAALDFAGGRLTRSACTGPHGEALQAAVWREGDLAVVEMARASGLSVTALRDPLRARSTGTGELVAAARAEGATRVWVGAGGSATVDGGLGALQALGYRFLDSAGRPTGTPAEVASIGPGVSLEDVAVLCDVDNPLLGPSGAAAVYAPQKGADARTVAQLEAGLARLGEVLAATFGRDPRHLPGAGAAGGLAGGLWAAGAVLRRGFDAVAEVVRLDAAVAGSDVVLTGEGRVDGQTRFGKTAAGVVDRASGRPTWIFGGSVTPEAEAWAPANVALVPVGDGPRSLDESVAEAPSLLRRAAARATRLWMLALLGCGAAPASAPTVPRGPVDLVVEHTAGSGYRQGCVSEAGVYAVRALHLERWDLPAGAPPRLRATVRVGELGRTPLATALGCEGGRALVLLGDQAVGVEGDEVVWRGRGVDATGWPAPKPGRKPPPGALWMERLADGRHVLLGEWGRGTRDGDDFREWRATAGGMEDAVFDGALVWAVGRSGLWRWRPGSGEPIPLTLPAEVAGRPLVGVFRDGPNLWLRDEEGIGWPVDARGTLVKLAGRSGRLPPPSLGSMTPIAGGLVEVTAEGQLVVHAEGTPRPEDAGRIHAMVRLDDHRVVVSVDDAVAMWAFDDAMRRTELGRVTLGSPTVQVFDRGDQLVAVGPGYGFALLKVVPRSPQR